MINVNQLNVGDRVKYKWGNIILIGVIKNILTSGTWAGRYLNIIPEKLDTVHSFWDYEDKVISKLESIKGCKCGNCKPNTYKEIPIEKENTEIVLPKYMQMFYESDKNYNKRIEKEETKNPTKNSYKDYYGKSPHPVNNVNNLIERNIETLKNKEKYNHSEGYEQKYYPGCTCKGCCEDRQQKRIGREIRVIKGYYIGKTGIITDYWFNGDDCSGSYGSWLYALDNKNHHNNSFGIDERDCEFIEDRPSPEIKKSFKFDIVTKSISENTYSLSKTKKVISFYTSEGKVENCLAPDWIELGKAYTITIQEKE